MKGLGEIAGHGPTKETILEPCCGDVNFDWNGVIATIQCNSKDWEKI
jgi:hypothetical protein